MHSSDTSTREERKRARSPCAGERGGNLREKLATFRYMRRALSLVWTTSRRLTGFLAFFALLSGVLPALAAWIGKLIVDGVIRAAQSGLTADRNEALLYVGIEAAVIAAMTASQRGMDVCRSLLRAQLGHRVNTLILEKALTLDLEHFEDSEFYDKLTRARREASMRPLSLVNQSFTLIQNAISLIAYSGLLVQFSPWALAIVVVAGLPVFLSEAKFAGEAFRLFRWRSPEARQQMYLETVLAREDYAKEVKIFGLGPLLLDRYRGIFRKLYPEDRSLTLRRNLWGFILGLLSNAAFYGAYVWIVLATVSGGITIGEMTMYLIVFKQGQTAVSTMLSSMGVMYEDNLYVSTLYELLEEPVRPDTGTEVRGPNPGDGIRFENVTFTYPGSTRPAVKDVSFHLAPGRKLAIVGRNGSGKTTLIKLLARLYEPDSGRIVLDGLDLREWRRVALHARIAVIFQDFVQYQFLVGENIGAGDVDRFTEEERWERAAEKGLARDFIEGQLPRAYRTQLGRWFAGGQELSGGQWQKIALSRAFMREGADIVVLDEPTATMDAEAEHRIFEHFGRTMGGRMVILISHRFSTVRMADEILVIDDGSVLERGSHEELLGRGGRYASLFELQARGYR